MSKDIKPVVSDRSVTVYSCAGTGINIVSELESARKEPTPGFANLNACYIDTSKSNLMNKNLPEEAIYLFDGIDGSGKVRSTNYEEIAKNVKSILLKFKPSDFNVVVHSGSGGSGSVIGPVIASELKARGHQVVVIMVGSTDTRIEIENTIKTLKSYESISIKRDLPIVMHYIENSRKLARNEVNKHAKRAISLLMGIFSGQNAELDTSDLKNWLEYTNISGTEPRLASLTFACDTSELDNAGTVISVATLASTDMDTRLDQTPAYQCVGYAPECWKTGAKDSLQLIGDYPIHYCISDDFIVTSVNALTKALKDVDDVFNSRNARNSIVDRNDNATDSGVII